MVGRIWLPDVGPVAVAIHAGALHDLSRLAATISQLLELQEPVGAIRAALREGRAPRVAGLEAVLANSWEPARIRGNPGCWRRATCRRSRRAA